MTNVFNGTPKYHGIRGDHARVADFYDRVWIRVIDVMDEEALIISMTPKQARALAQGIIAAAEKAEAHQ